MTPRPALATRIVLTCFLLALALWIGLGMKLFVMALLSEFLGVALASTLIIHLRIRPYLSDLLLVLAATALLSVIMFWTLELKLSFKVALAFLGLSSFGVMAIRLVWLQGEERKFLFWGFVPALLFSGSLWLYPPLLKLSKVIWPETLDRFLYSFDASLHFQPSFLLGMVFWRWHWLYNLSVGFYLSLPVVIALVYVENLRRRREDALSVLFSLLLLGPLGWICYNCFPACGPIHLFHADFPFHALSFAQARELQLIPVAVNSERNAIPSLHMAWVLIAWWYAKGQAWWVKLVALAFLVFTVMATLGTGEHYFIDLIVAFPFTLMVRALFCYALPWKNRERQVALLTGLSGTFLWFGLLRYAMPFFWISPAIPWAFVVATIAIVQFRKNCLLRAADFQRLVSSSAPESLLPTVEEPISVVGD